MNGLWWGMFGGVGLGKALCRIKEINFSHSFESNNTFSVQCARLVIYFVFFIFYLNIFKIK